MALRTLNYGNYGIFLIMGNAGFCPSTVSMLTIITLTVTRSLSKSTRAFKHVAIMVTSFWSSRKARVLCERCSPRRGNAIQQEK